MAIHLTRDSFTTKPAGHRTFCFVELVAVMVRVFGLIVNSRQILAPHFYRCSFFLYWLVFLRVFHYISIDVLPLSPLFVPGLIAPMSLLPHALFPMTRSIGCLSFIECFCCFPICLVYVFQLVLEFCELFAVSTFHCFCDV
jgi:hypothetical protein